MGRPREATDSLAAVAWQRGWAGASGGIVRITAARWLAAEGDLDQAARLLPWWQAMIPDVEYIHVVELLWGPSLLEMARVEAARGNREVAREDYRRFLWLWDLPSLPIRHLVNEARVELRKLG
jgi:hypothetical protein